MIKFSLQCAAGHDFDAWFRDNATYERQEADGDLECALCGDRSVRKAIMAPAISRGRSLEPQQLASPETSSQSSPQASPQTTSNGAPAQPAAEVAVGRSQPAPVSPEMAHNALRFVAAMRALKSYVETNFEDVGKRFPDEARKIHYGESEERGIFGQASEDDVADLRDEGIEIAALPVLPELDS